MSGAMFDRNFDPRQASRTDAFWCPGPNGRFESPPAAIQKYATMCARGELNGPIDTDFECIAVEQILREYAAYIREWVDKTVQQRQHSDKSVKEKSHPLFHSDPDGRLAAYAEELRDLAKYGRRKVGSSSTPKSDEDLLASPDPSIDGTPTNKQELRLRALIESRSNNLTEEDKHLLVEYIGLNAAEYARLTEMQRVFDRASCYFLEHMISPTLKVLLNAERVKHLPKIMDWATMKQHLFSHLDHTALEGELFDAMKLCRPEKTPIDVWLAQVETTKAVLPIDIRLPDRAWVLLLTSQFSLEERRSIQIPDRVENVAWDNVKNGVNACDPKNFPVYKFSMVKNRHGMRIIELHLALKEYRANKDKPDSHKAPRDRNDRRSRQARATIKEGSDSPAEGGDLESKTPPKQVRITTKDVPHEKPNGVPEDLPNFKENSLRDRLLKRIKDSKCARCGGDHLRSACSKPREKWEDDFEQPEFWTKKPASGTKKLQNRSSLAFGPGSVITCHADVQPPTSDSHTRCTLGLDTFSDVNTAPEHLLDDVHQIRPVEVVGTNGPVIHSRAGVMEIHTSQPWHYFWTQDNIVSVPFLVADNIPDGTDAILGIPGIRQLGVSIDRHLGDQTLNLDPNVEVLEHHRNSDVWRKRVQWTLLLLALLCLIPQLVPLLGFAIPAATAISNIAATTPNVCLLPGTAGANSMFEIREGYGIALLQPDTISTSSPPEPPTPSPHLYERSPLEDRLAGISEPQSLAPNPVDYDDPRLANLTLNDLLELPGNPADYDGLNLAELTLEDPLELPALPPPVTHLPASFTQFMQRSVFNAGSAVRATGSLCAPVTNTSTAVVIGLDSFSDVTLCRRSLLHNVHRIQPDDVTGTGGVTTYHEQGDMAVEHDGDIVFVPALAAPASHLPSDCDVLLGVPGIDQLHADLNHHLANPRDKLQCRLGEKQLRRWLEHNSGKAVESKPFNLNAISINPDLPPDIIRRIKDLLLKYCKVFEGAKDALPKPFANQPPVELRFKPGVKPTCIPEPKWTAAQAEVITKWALDGLASGQLEKSKSPWASRPHVVKKPPPGVHPDDADIKDCKLRVCGDYRAVNECFEKISPNLPLGTDELKRTAGHRWYIESDAHGCYQAFILASGPSREALAVHTPIGLVQPTVLPFGQKNAGTHAQGPIRFAMSSLPKNTRDHLANYMDDFVLFDDDLNTLVEHFEEFLHVCADNSITLNPHKTKVGYPSADFFGFTTDKDGTRLAEKNLDPVSKMVPPTDISGVRRVLGVFQQCRAYLGQDYATVALPLTTLTRGRKPVFAWGEEQQTAFETIRDRLLERPHLHPPDYDLPFHYYSDASEDGKGGVLCQYPPDVEHKPENAKVISYFSKAWTDTERKKPPFYLEASALLWGIEKCRIYALSSRFPLHTYSDHLPLRWMDKCDKGAISSFMIEQLSDIERVHSYIPGEENVISDAVSRYPMLGPNRIAPRGLTHMTTDLLDRLPERLRTAENVHCHAGPETGTIARIIQSWRKATNPVHRIPPRTDNDPPAADLVIYAPPVDRTPEIAAQLLTSTTPFALLMPLDLAHVTLDRRLARKANLDHDLLVAKFDGAAKITVLATQMLWLVGGIPELANSAITFASTLATPAPLLEKYDGTLPNPAVPTHDVPTTIEQWIEAQEADPACTTGIPPSEIVHQDGLALHAAADHPLRIIVPEQYREPLIRQRHEDLFHLGIDKTAHSLLQSYFWPKPKTTVRRVLNDCAACELAKARRNEAHGMFRTRPLEGPRQRVCMDYQGQTKALTGETEACAIIDEFSRWVVVIPLHSRSAIEFTPKFVDAVLMGEGPPAIVHSDAAKQFTSEFQKQLAEVYSFTRTTTLGHNARGNAMVEIFWRFWNRCMRLLSDVQIKHWPTYCSRVCWAYNTAVHDSTSTTPFAIMRGVPAPDPFTPVVRPNLDEPLPDFNPDDARQYAQAVRTSVNAFSALAKNHSDYVQQTTSERLNMQGSARSYEIGDHVKVMVPPTAKQIAETGRPAKHLLSWRGPCEVVDIISNTGYKVRELSTNRHFERTLVNISRFRATTPAPHQAAFDPLAHDPFEHGELIAIRDAPASPFYLAHVLEMVDDTLRVHYLGCQSPNPRTAVFRPCWSHAESATITLQHTQPANCTQWTGDIDITDLDELLVARRLNLTARHRLDAPSLRKLAAIIDELYVFAR